MDPCKNVFQTGLVGTELPQSHQQSAESGYLAGDVTPVQDRKRHFDATSESDPLAAKRARSTRTGIPQPGVEDRKAEQAAKVWHSLLMQVTTNGGNCARRLDKRQSPSLRCVHTTYPLSLRLRDQSGFLQPRGYRNSRSAAIATATTTNTSGSGRGRHGRT